MGITKKKKRGMDRIIGNDNLVFLHWSTRNKCIPCKNSERKWKDINKDIKSSIIKMVFLNIEDYPKDFKKLGNRILPSVNVFFNGNRVKYQDSKIMPGKKLRVIHGERQSDDIARIIGKTIKRFLTGEKSSR
jgi:hypothetical protein